MFWEFYKNKWYLFPNDEEDSIAEIGVEEDGTFYWVECETQSGYNGFETFKEAQTDAQAYFVKEEV